MSGVRFTNGVMLGRSENTMKTVIVFEPDCALRALYKEELEHEGYNIYLSKNDREALAMLKQRTIDILITEYQLNPTETYSTVLNFARELKKIPVIILTNHPRGLIECEWWGEIEYVSKMSNLDALKITMKGLLDYKGYVDKFYKSQKSLKQQELYL
jgi:DNA-binding NtrC family response regulator